MPLSIAWETFGSANGVRSLSDMRRRVNALRRNAEDNDVIGCVVLSDVVVLAQTEHVEAPKDWKPNIVRIAGYDMLTGEGARVWNQLRALDIRAAQPEHSSLLSTARTRCIPAHGYGRIRTTMRDHRRAHATHHIRNGILMRSDVHRLYDLGLVTVESDLTFRVSKSIERDYSNGKMYYVLDGKKIATPARPEHRPDSEALDWHATSVFRP